MNSLDKKELSEIKGGLVLAIALTGGKNINKADGCTCKDNNTQSGINDNKVNTCHCQCRPPQSNSIFVSVSQINSSSAPIAVAGPVMNVI